MKKLKLVFIFFALPMFMFSQNNEPPTNNAKVKIFLDCNRPWLCDEDFLRNELKMVDYVRDRFLSDVHVIVNTQFTGSGGEQNELVTKGLGRFEGENDTIRYFNNPTATDDDKRQNLLKYLKLGLIRFVAQSFLADKIQITYTDDKKDSSKTTPQHDPWNYWQFSFGASGFFNGNKNQSSSDVSQNISANRETEKSRFNFYGNNNISRRRFTVFQDKKEEVVKVVNDRQSIDASYAFKLNQHWAWGFNAEFQRSIFENFDASYRLAPRIEYSILPYKKFNSERFIVQYSIGPRAFNYQDTTIYFKTKEILLQQKLGIISSLTKPWGTINVGAFWSNYLDDFSKNNASIGGGISWRVFKGFQFAIGGNFELVHDQISLPKQGASRDDVLTQRRIIATNYDYFFGVGMSYRFGSIFNSQVHPTFKGLNYSLNF
jgi:hypothetical protein